VSILHRALVLSVSLWLPLTTRSAAAESAAPTMVLPFVESFDKPTLDAAWKAHLSKGNAIEVKAHGLEIRARSNTQAHIERGLNADLLCAACAIGREPAPRTRACSSIGS